MVHTLRLLPVENQILEEIYGVEEFAGSHQEEDKRAQ